MRLYDIAMSAGATPKKFSPAYTGGLFGPFVVIAVLLAYVFYTMARKADAEALKKSLFAIHLFLLITLATSFMPQSHELRYYLYWPILLVFLTAILARTARISAAKRLMTATAYAIFLAFSQLLVGFMLWPLRYNTTQQQQIMVNENFPEIVYARKHGGICLGPDYNPSQFRYASIFHGGDYVVEQGWKKCEQFPAFSRTPSAPAQ